MSIFSVLANDKNIILYRKELNQITGGVTSSILLQQIIYWWDKSDSKPFYKFIMPCNHAQYRAGDSWAEELGFSRKEFITAYARLDKNGLVSKKTDANRVTQYSLNECALNAALESVFLKPKRDLAKAQKGFTKSPKGDLPLYTETTTETTHSIVVSEVIEHLNARAGTAFRNAAGHAKFINARIKEGATLDDFKLVIDKKCREWLGTDMAKNLRPSTLFRPANFENYIGQLEAGSSDTAQPDYSPSDVIALYNDICGGVLKRVTVDSSARSKSVAAISRIKTITGKQPLIEHGLDSWRDIFEDVMASDFHTGGASSGWKADFDWIVSEKNITATLEKFYNA